MATKKQTNANHKPKAIEVDDDKRNEHRVTMSLGKVELPKNPAGITLTVATDEKGAVGKLTVSKGGLVWQVGNNAPVQLSWNHFARLAVTAKESRVEQSKKILKTKRNPAKVKAKGA